MNYLPFFLDRSPTARLIREIGKPGGIPDALKQLVGLLRGQGDHIKYDHLSEIWRRSEKALARGPEPSERELLDELLRAARWRVQRIHIVSG